MKHYTNTDNPIDFPKLESKMNERIKELAEQAGIDFFNSTDPEYFGRVYCEGWSEQQQKFAELIVRECAELAGEETSLPYDSYSEKIKEHFGVTK